MESSELKKLIMKYEFAKKSLETYLEILLTEYELENGYNPVEHIKSRIKTEASATKKLQKKGYEVNVENLKDHIHDMVGFRIVCSFLSDVYDIVELIRKTNQFTIREESDYIKNPKESGYVSYHLNVLVPINLKDKKEYIEAEIQVRTIAMDLWASLDHKLRYKLREDIPVHLQQEMLDCSDKINMIDKDMQHLYERVKKYQNKETQEEKGKVLQKTNR